MSLRLSQIILFAVVTCLLAASVAAQREKSVLMPTEIARYMHPPNPDVPAAPTWEPTKQEITELENSFDRLAVLKPERECCRRSAFVFQPDAYYMQYSAIYLDGHAYIHINAFRELPKKREDDWRKQWIMAKGGGTNYWQALYDPATKSFSRLIFNSDK